jgi:hypothetical protein
MTVQLVPRASARSSGRVPVPGATWLQLVPFGSARSSARRPRPEARFVRRRPTELGVDGAPW